MRRSSLRTFGGIALAAATVACGTDRPIRIGLAGPFGELRAAAMRVAAELAVRELNAAGGVRGRPLELVVLDDSGRAERAVEVARTFANDPTVVAVVGHLTSGATMAAAPVYGGQQPVLVISPSASSPLVTDAGPWVFRVCPTDELHGTRLAAWARDRLRASRAAVLYVNDDYGRGVRDMFVQAFTAAGGEILGDDPYLDNLPSFRPYLERQRRRGAPDVLLIAGTRGGAERVLATLDSVGLKPAVLGGDGLVGIEAATARAEGMYLSTAYLPDRPGAANEAFIRAYQAANADRLPDHRGAGAYDAVRLIARAIEAAGTDRRRIRDYLAGVGTRHPAFDGVSGRIAFDENGDVPEKDIVIGVVRAGRLQTAGGS